MLDVGDLAYGPGDVTRWVGFQLLGRITESNRLNDVMDDDKAISLDEHTFHGRQHSHTPTCLHSTPYPNPPMSSFDSDTGDISLSFSSSTLAATPQRSSSSASSSHPNASRMNDRANAMTSPRMYSKSLWERRASAAEAGPSSISLSESLPGPSGRQRGSTGGSTSTTNTRMTPNSDSASRSLDPDQTPRRASQALHDRYDNLPMPTRRTSSQATITRSRSLNVRIPSEDRSASIGQSPFSRSPPTLHPASATASSRTPSSRLAFARRPGEVRPAPMLDAETAGRMGRWVKEVVVCNFDLERGPVVERRVAGRRWGPGEKENV
jgi:hypothetical protein